jgi:hypothetical protein
LTDSWQVSVIVPKTSMNALLRFMTPWLIPGR